MSMTLNMADRLLVRGRNLQQLGRSYDAARLLARLCGLRELPPVIAEETNARLAELLLEQGRLREARRHLTAALTLEPESARYHFLMATTLNDEDTGDLARALEHYRKSLAADADQVVCLVEAGRLAIRLGKTQEGLADLRRAVELEPAKPEPLHALVGALCELGEADEAQRALLAGMFRNPGDRRFRREWNDFRFQRLFEERKALQQQRDDAQAAASHPMILPFVRPENGTAGSQGGSMVRRHGASRTPPPHFPAFRHTPNRKHA